MSKEEVLSIIKEYPEAIIEALERKPELLTSLILKLAPWDRFATKEDIRMILEFMEKRFDDINKRFEAIDKRFEDLISYSDKRFEELKSYSDKRFESIDKRFEDVNKRFEDMKYYVDRRFDEVNRRLTAIERIMIAFNIPILIAILTMLIKAFVG
jgi:hypothetical protein